MLACLKVTRWCQLIRKTIKLCVVAWVSSFLIAPTTALALSLSHQKAVPADLVQYILPRFSLKTRVRFDRVQTSGDIQFLTEEPDVGTAIFTLASGVVVYVGISASLAKDSDYIAFVDWLSSEPGRATISDFRQEGSQVAFPVAAAEAAPVEVVIVGDLDNGRELSINHCRRCHKVDRADKYAGIGNSPSFHAMRSFDDWYVRFATFYAVSPHKALISVEGSGIKKDRSLITIAPIDLKMSDINDIVAFVHSLTPLDLGKPIQANP